MAGGGRVTAADVARSLGLSRATVGFVLNDTPGQTISVATRRRVLAEASRLGYRPHPAARALATGRSHVVMLLLPDWPVDFALRTSIEEASAVLDRAGYSLVTHTPPRSSLARPLWEILQPDVVVSLRPLASGILEQLRRAGIAYVTPEPGQASSAYPEPGPALQVEYLASLGHRRIGYVGISDPRIADLVAVRTSRALEAAARCGLDLVDMGGVALAETDMAVLADRCCAEGITAVAAYNDEVAIGLLGAARRSGIRVPEELAVIGHDDTPVASLMEPQLTSIRMDVVGLGRYLAASALSKVDESLSSPAEPTFLAEVVRRAST